MLNAATNGGTYLTQYFPTLTSANSCDTLSLGLKLVSMTPFFNRAELNKLRAAFKTSKAIVWSLSPNAVLKTLFGLRDQ